ncbi:uncharacterized protein LOC112084392 [Eutrema salsugineum]|uniref:uncharacterized protein LOC112084392 n=1 Tax=Eutrema salsugineum TaxID=72664 RepID=UPI000CED584D|nr:uncharacterized protein LOC112084392 [Eutrema salsugineum]
MEENDSDATLPSDTYTKSQLPSQRSVRQKHDLAWAHVTQTLDSEGKSILTCDFCGQKNKGVGINRMKQHLAGQKGNTNGCKKVPPEIQYAMRKSLKENEDKAKEKSGINIRRQFHDVDDGQGSHQGCVPSQKRKSTWADTGCTLMADGWKDTRQRPLINFLVYCPKGIIFIKSVDASGIYTNAENLCNLFAEIVEMIGPQNVVHMVTDNAPNYKAAGAKLVERYPAIYWSPCASHCIILKFQDVGQLPHVEKLTSYASKITVFKYKYNHKHILNWLRNRPGWKEIIRPAETRFATNFIALQSLLSHKDYLQSMVVDEEFRKISRSEKTKLVKQLIFDEEFWNGCFMIVQIMTPLIRLLRICDADEKPSLPYVYEGMYRARLGIKKIFDKDKDLYRLYTKIIDNRWDKMLRRDIYAAAYFLNPAFLYDKKNFSDKPEITRGMLNLIEKQNGGLSETKLVSTVGRYRDREGSFSREMALNCRKTTRPDEWWKLFGCDIPDLQKLAIRILSQTATSSGCERNWSVFERIHTKKRNRPEHQRLNDLVYVHYNLRLQNRSKRSRSYDPVDYESIDKTEFWIVEEEEEGELDFSELQDKLLEEYPKDDLEKED